MPRVQKTSGDNILAEAVHVLNFAFHQKESPTIHYESIRKRTSFFNVLIKIMQSMELHSDEMPKSEAFPQLYSS